MSAACTSARCCRSTCSIAVSRCFRSRMASPVCRHVVLVSADFERVPALRPVPAAVEEGCRAYLIGAMLHAIPLVCLDQSGNVTQKNTQGCACMNRLKCNLVVAAKCDGVWRTRREYIQSVRGCFVLPSCGHQIQQGLPQAP